MSDAALGGRAGERAGAGGRAAAGACSRAGPTPCASSTWRCELGARVSALHVNYGLRDEAGGDEEHCRALCASLERGARSVERVRAARGRQPAGARARGPLPAGRGPRRRRLRRAPTRPPTRPRPCSTASRSRPGAGRCSAWSRAGAARAPAPGRHRARRRAPTAGPTGCPGARTRRTPIRASRARARARGSWPRCARWDRRPSARWRRPRCSCATRRRCSTPPWPTPSRVSAVGRSWSWPGWPRCRAALARLVLRSLAEAAAGGPRALSRADVDAVLRLGESGGSRSVDLGEGLQAVVEYGTLRFRPAEIRRRRARARGAGRARRRLVRGVGGRGHARRRR